MGSPISGLHLPDLPVNQIGFMVYVVQRLIGVIGLGVRGHCRILPEGRLRGHPAERFADACNSVHGQFGMVRQLFDVRIATKRIAQLILGLHQMKGVQLDLLRHVDRMRQVHPAKSTQGLQLLGHPRGQRGPEGRVVGFDGAGCEDARLQSQGWILGGVHGAQHPLDGRLQMLHGRRQIGGRGVRHPRSMRSHVGRWLL